ETGIAELIGRLAGAPRRPLQIDVDRAIAWFEERHGLMLAAEQKRALGLALTRMVLVITGGPGTGKTTLIRGILEILGKKGVEVLLAAPTGRAAKRMTEATGHESKTLHRLLEFNP